MNGSALYYPNIDVRDPAWLRSALLYWDDLYTIVPRAIKTPYETDDTKICFEEGQLRPLYCDDHPEVIKSLGERTLELIAQLRSPLPFTLAVGEAEPNLVELWEAFRSPTRVQLHRDKAGYSELHPDKVSFALRQMFERAEKDSSEWMLVNADFSDMYMAALALLLAEARDDLVPVTNSAVDHGSAVYSLLADSASVSVPQAGRLVSLTMKNLRIDPETPIAKIITFKQKRRHQLIELSAKLNELNSKIKEADPKEMERQAKRIYTDEVEKGMADLKSELQAASIQSTWDAFQRCMSLTVPGQTVAVAAASHLLPPSAAAISHAIALGSGALLTLTDVAVKTYFARRKARRDSKYTYLLDAQRAFSAPTKASAGMLMQAHQQYQRQ
ncbi:DUF6236 family protein [Bradyrhizobium sp. B120]|uniref:DUF6236 family protein n=1 Tax=Bradyrhizobium sp. B120 TaxID=3410088 RepID=UPI003B987944